MKIVFMGTPEFAVPTLDALIKSSHQVTAVVTQPDRPKGRGKAVVMSAVKEKALSCDIPIFQPVRVKKDREFLEQLRELAPDVIVVVAFGQLLPREILTLPKYGCVNVHASLLPKYRGAAPIQWSVIDGESQTGITTMLMDEGLDTGDMLETMTVPLAPQETGGSLHDKLSPLGGELILSTLEGLKEGTIVRTPQPSEGTSYASMLHKGMGDIDWTRDALSIERLIRGLSPWPSAYTGYRGKTLKLWSAQVLDLEGEWLPGQIVKAGKDALHIATGKGLLAVLEIQPEGKKRMTVDAFLRGYEIEEGEFVTVTADRKEIL